MAIKGMREIIVLDKSVKKCNQNLVSMQQYNINTQTITKLRLSSNLLLDLKQLILDPS